MALQAIFKFRNIDATLDFNRRFELLFEKGIYNGSSVTPVASTLQVNLSPFRAINNEGMIVIENDNSTLIIPVGQTSYVITRAKYLSNTDPILVTEVLEESVFNSDPDVANLIVHAKIVLGSGATEVQAGDIDEIIKQTIDPVKRLNFRGVLANQGLLPASNTKVGDAFIITDGTGDTPEMFVYNGVTFINVTSAGTVIAALDSHRQNLNTNEIHLTDLQAGAVGGTNGTPGPTNRFVTNSDPRVPTQDENDALVGSDGAPNSANRYVTLARSAIESSRKVFSSTPVDLVLTVSEGPIFVGKGLANSADKFFKLLDNSTGSIYKLAGSPNYISVSGVFKDQALTSILDPSIDADADGFYSASSLYLRANTIPDSGITIAYGKQKTIGSVDFGSEVFTGPQDYPFQKEILQAIADIKEDAVDTPLPVGRSLASLATGIDNQRIFLDSAFTTDVVVSPLDYTRLLKTTDAAEFSPTNIGLPDVVSFSNTLQTPFTYTSGTGIIQFSGVVDLSSVNPFNFFRDGSLNKFIISSVNNGTNTITLATGLTVDTVISSSDHGSVITDNNPFNKVMSDMRVVYGVERFIFSRSQVIPNQFIGDQPTYEVFQSESSQADQRLILVGEWNQNITSSNDVKIIVIFYGTGLDLLTDLQSLPSTIAVKIDNAVGSAIDPTQAGTVANPGNDGSRNLPIIRNLSKAVHTIELSFDSGATPFKFNGFEVITESNTITDLTGRAFVHTSLIKTDTLQFTAIPTNSKGGSLVRYIDNISNVKQFANNPTTVILSSCITDGTNVLKNVNSPSGFAINQVVRISDNVGNVHFDIITAVSIGLNTVTIVNTPTFSSASTLEFILLPGINAGHGNEKQAYRIGYRELINPTPLALDLAGVAQDNSTILVGEQVLETTSGISGIPVALTGTKVRFTFVGTGLDLLVANTASASPVAIIDGIRTQTLTITGTGLQRVLVLSDAPYGSHTVEITMNGAMLSEFIVYETDRLPFSGLALAESNILSDYKAGADADPNEISLGTVYKATSSDFVFKTGTIGSVDWVIENSLSLAPRTGVLKKSNKTDAEIQISFYGSGFEFEFLAGPTNAIAEFVLDGVILTAINFGSATIIGNNYDSGTGRLDMFLGANSPNRKVRVAGLNLDYHSLSIRNTGVISVGATDSFINVEGIGIIVPTWINIVRQNRLLLGNNNIKDLRTFTTFDQDILANLSAQGIGSSVGSVYEETDSITSNGTTSIFILPASKTYDVGSKKLQVWKNGVRMFIVDDYNEIVDPDGLGRKIQFQVPPASGAKIGYRIA